MSGWRWSRRWASAAGAGLAALGLAAGVALAQSADAPSPLPKGPAKQVFGAFDAPADGPPAAIGGYARGCMAGGRTLDATGPGWQVMRLSRNRNHGHPTLIAFIERLAASAQDLGWPGVLVGDMAQPLGGPMLTGHRSHQIGLDVDIWMRPAPDRTLSRREREAIGSQNMVAEDWRRIARAWTPTHAEVLKAAALDPAVARIFVNPVIKIELCRATAGQADRAAWLRRIRPWWGHNYHFHVRLRCPEGSPGCQDQREPPPGDGCVEAAGWLGKTPRRGAPRAPLTLADLPPACQRLVREAR